MDKRRIEDKMHELEKIIKYQFNDVKYLSNAMNRNLIPSPFREKKQKSYFNEYYALIGDAIIKIVLSNYLYNKKDLKLLEK